MTAAQHPTTMQAAVFHAAGDVRLSRVSCPTPGAGEVTLRVAYCGVCGSDLHEYADGPHAIPARHPHPASGATAPLVLGHEFCGTVTRIGRGVRQVAPGQRVAVEPNYRCGQCARCRSGEYNVCAHFGFAGLMGDGGLAEYATVPGYMVHPLPEAVSLLQAAVFEPASVALHALRRGGVTTGSRVAVAGLGPVGLLTVQLARARGASWIAGLDPLPQRRQLARELGADAAYDCWPGDAHTVDTAFEVAGVQGALDSCLAAARTGGRIVLAGLGGQFSLDSAALVNSERSLIATVGYRDTYPELIRLVAKEGLDLTRIVTSVIPLPQVVERGLQAPPGEIKVLVRPR